VGSEIWRRQSTGGFDLHEFARSLQVDLRDVLYNVLISLPVFVCFVDVRGTVKVLSFPFLSVAKSVSACARVFECLNESRDVEVVTPRMVSTGRTSFAAKHPDFLSVLSKYYEETCARHVLDFMYFSVLISLVVPTHGCSLLECLKVIAPPYKARQRMCCSIWEWR